MNPSQSCKPGLQSEILSQTQKERIEKRKGKIEILRRGTKYSWKVEGRRIFGGKAEGEVE